MKRPQHTLHLIGGEKGGVGKTVLARVLVERGLELSHTLTIAECDRMNPDLYRLYKGVGYDTILAYFSEDPMRRTKADALFAAAMEQTVVANLPAQCLTAMTDWFLQDSLADLGRENGVGFCLWWVSNGGYDSLKLFRTSLEQLGAFIPHVFVRNLGLCDDWAHVESDKAFLAALRKGDVPVIDLPKMPYAERNFIEANQIPFSAAVNDPRLTVVSRQRVKTFLRNAFAEIESVGIFP